MATYTITDTIFQQLQADAKSFNDAVAALVPDSIDPAVLQQELTAAQAEVTLLQNRIAAAKVDLG